MCGIAGVVGESAPPGAGAEMVARLGHRGPDDSGCFADGVAQLAHARLAILDLSGAGHQPMELGDLVLVYNGELYNHRELRTRLSGPFVSTTDSETLLHALATWGGEALGQLTGMFAFALWDRRHRRLFLARDRLGIKPLYYQLRPDGIAFASEIKALLALGTPAIDRSALCDFFTYKFVPAPKTIHQGIFKLPPGHTLSWQDGRVELARYWQASSSETVVDMDEAVEALDGLLARVIPEHQMADVPTGVFLSGGIDSATMVSFLDRPRTFTLGFDVAHRDEAPAARRVAEHFHTEHREERVSPVSIEQALDMVVRTFDEPFGDSAAWSNFEVARLARRWVTVAISGEGGDELFLGYQRQGKQLQKGGGLLRRLGSAIVPPLSLTGRSLQRRAAEGFDRYAILSGPFSPAQTRALLHPELAADGDEDPLWAYRRWWRPDLEPRKAMQFFDIHTTMVDGILAKVDRTSMAHALEVRPPLLDHRVVEFALSLSPDLLRNRDGRLGKLILRRLMGPRLPEGHLERPKSGFNLPIRRWSRANPEILGAALDRLADARIIRRPGIARFGSEQIWSLLVLDRWLTTR
jgi:asparagine synthase (glutamine-hydrolysing)